MKLYVARHGQTQWNALDKICGLTDLPLTEEGRQQAQLLAGRLEGKDIRRIIASPLIRAMETAGAVSEKLGLPIEQDARLIEMNYGIYEGTYRKGEGFLSNKRQFAYRYPQGESMMQVAHRTYSLLEELKNENPGQNTLLVCHGGVARVIRTYFCDMTNEEFFHYSMENATYEEYEL